MHVYIVFFLAYLANVPVSACVKAFEFPFAAVGRMLCKVYIFIAA